MAKVDTLLKSNYDKYRREGIDICVEDASAPFRARLAHVAKGGWRRRFSWFDFDDQAYALEGLAKIEKRDTLEFLRRFFTFIIKREADRISDVSVHHELVTVGYSAIVTFPYASGNFGSALPFEKYWNHSYDSNHSEIFPVPRCKLFGGREPNPLHPRREEAYEVMERVCKRISAETLPVLSLE
jgi:hypothetical protein